MSVWYVAPHVTSGGKGTQAEPWSLAHACLGAPGAGGVPTIKPGDQVLLRGGIYFAMKGYLVSVSGAPDARVEFAPYPGEAPLIDGTYREFWQGTEAWQRVGSGPQHVYRSVNDYANPSGYGALVDVDGFRITLAPHPDLTWLMSERHEWSDAEPYYLGPGIAWDADGIFVRLDNSSPAAQANRDTVVQFSSQDPNHYAIRVAPIGLKGLTIRGSHLAFTNLAFRGYDLCWFVEGSPTDLRFVDCVAEPQRRVVRLGAATDVKILGGTFLGHTHSDSWWVSVLDLHGGPARWAEKSAIGLDGASNVELGPSPSGRRMTVRQFFDGILAGGPLCAIDVHGIWFDEIWDDAWQMVKQVSNVRYHDNVHFGAGPSRYSIPREIEPDARIYIYDNVIDTTQHRLFWWRGGRGITPAEGESIAFSAHVQPAANEPAYPWKIYHNTVVTGRLDETDRIVGCGYIGLNTAAGRAHEAFNNIFVARDGKALHHHFWATSRREIYDGNCIWSAGAWGTPGKPGPYPRLHTSQHPNGTHAASLESFRELAEADSHLYYKPGWEKSGVEVDPEFTGFYMPTHRRVVSGAVDLTRKQWPGTSQRRHQRGAVLSTGLPIGPKQVVVPYVAGELHRNAGELLSALGLTYEVVSPSAVAAPVRNQDPLPGTIVTVGTKVYLDK